VRKYSTYEGRKGSSAALKQVSDRLDRSKVFTWGKGLRGMAVAAVLASAVYSAEAVTYSFTPDLTQTGSAIDQLNELDHHNAYMWTLSNLDKSLTYTSATLKITNINNWDNTKNELFFHLFDTARLSGSGVSYVGSNYGTTTATMNGRTIYSTVTTFVDDPTSSQLDIGDAFSAPDISSNPLVVQSATQNVFLGSYVDGYYVGTRYYPDNPNNPETVTVNFNSTQLAALNAYIQNGQNLSLAFDPDCHYYNDGISFTMTGYVTPVPEGSALISLVGVFGLVAGVQYCKWRRGQAPKGDDATVAPVVA
jgi:hypothetical protein